ncbi:MAG: NAD-dependent epimerase/dehydratase family protein [Candidatus Staskawiczbacteria bacterium]|nr:NAD-dependent epimerase/dehydratase family protein [Candidatus Staskawiczbacteria bacterium]
MKCLVTGGAGFIGSHLVDKLLEEGHSVKVIDNLSTGKKENLNKKADFYQLDICDFEKIKPLFKGIDLVFHLAAVPRVPVSVNDPVGTSKINILGSINVFKAAKDGKAKRVVFASSAAVYGRNKSPVLKETMTLNPESPYGFQKLASEQAAKLFNELYNIPIVCLRYFNVYGPRIDFDSDYSLVLGRFLKLAKLKKPLTIFGTGSQTRAFCYISDAVLAAVKAAESKKIKGGEIINIGHEKSFSVNFLAGLIGGKKEYLQERPGDILKSQADISLAKKILGWQPCYDLEQGVKETEKWFENYA